MSRGGILEEHVMCSVCFEVCNNPHALRCLHTFCKPCIDHLHKHGRRKNPEVECPDCRERTKINQLRKDFKMQNLIDSYNSKQDDLPSDQSEITKGALCGMCNVAGKAMHSQCVECEHNMCKECDVIHRGRKKNKNHTVKPLKDVLTQIRSDVKSSMICLQKKKDHCQKTSACVKNAIDHVMHSNIDQLSEVDGSFNSLVDDLRKVHRDLRKKITRDNGQILNQLMEQRDMFDKIGDDLESYMHSFTDIMNSDDITELSKIAKDIERIKKLIKIPCIENITDCLKWRLLQSKYREVKSLKLNFFAGDICFNNGQIFCGNRYKGSIEVFDKELNLLRSLKHPKLEFMRRIVSVNETDMIAVCCFGIQYVQLYGSTSIHVTTIAEHPDYTDVCMFEKSIYALDFEKGRIHVFKYNKKNTNWVEGDEYVVQKYCDRLHVNQREIMVSSARDDCVFLYDKHSGKYRAKFDSTQEFNVLKICNLVSCCENVLIIDNGTFQILSSKGEWNQILFEKDLDVENFVDNQLDAALDNENMDMYLLYSTEAQFAEAKFKLVKFSF